MTNLSDGSVRRSVQTSAVTDELIHLLLYFSHRNSAALIDESAAIIGRNAHFYWRRNVVSSDNGVSDKIEMFMQAKHTELEAAGGFQYHWLIKTTQNGGLLLRIVD